MNINIGDILTMKKQHPCGSKEWEVLRIGADFKFCCFNKNQAVFKVKSLEKTVTLS